MTVGELIELLRNYSPDMAVVIYEPGDHSVGIWDYQGEIRTVRQMIDVTDDGNVTPMHCLEIVCRS